MNKEFLKLDDKSYAITNETGELKIVNTKEDTSLNNLDDVLKLENYIDELYNKLKECNKNIKNFNSKIKNKRVTYIIFLIMLIIIPSILPTIFVIDNLKDYIFVYMLCFPFVAIFEGIVLASDIAIGGTIKSIKKKKEINKENKQEILEEIKTKQNELNKLKNNINYLELDLNKVNNLKENIDYSYKFQPKIVNEMFHEKKQVKSKILKND